MNKRTTDEKKREVNNGKTGKIIKGLSILLVLVFISSFLTYSNADATQLCSGQSAVLLEAQSGRVLYSKNAHQTLPMASTTKIATAITVIENCDVSQMVTVNEKAVGIEGSSIYLQKNEKITVLDLLYGLMLRSGNDSATALAYHVSGSVEDFAQLMNSTAKKVGANNTNFVNPHGLDHSDHYTTAYDLALITAYALKNSTFSEIVSCKRTKIGANQMDIANKNKLLFSYPECNGVKTGFTKKSGRCFVGSAYKENMQLVAVVLNCGPMFEESKNMLEYGFEHYSMANILPANKLVGLEISDGERRYIGLKEAFSYPLRKDGSEEGLIVKRYEEEKEFSLGKICVYFDKQLIFSQKLVTI